MKNKIVERSFLPSFIFNDKQVIITVGQDGLVANTAKYVKQIPIVAVAIDTDRLFPVRLQAEIADLAPLAADLVVISSPFGHDGFLVEVESVGITIKEALALS